MFHLIQCGTSSPAFPLPKKQILFSPTSTTGCPVTQTGNLVVRGTRPKSCPGAQKSVIRTIRRLSPILSGVASDREEDLTTQTCPQPQVAVRTIHGGDQILPNFKEGARPLSSHWCSGRSTPKHWQYLDDFNSGKVGTLTL